MIVRIGLSAALVSVAVFAAEASADCRRAPELEAFPELVEPAAAGPTETDRTGRVVAPIRVNGAGPYRFIIDTGANRSALSSRLAQRLGLTAGATGQVHSVYGASQAPMVDVRTVHYGEVALPSGRLPILSAPVLAGEHGLLGVDGMAGRRLTLDFQRRCIEIEPSRGAGRLRGWAELHGELRFGHLIVVPGRVNGVRVNVLIDTGSDTSLANTALYRALDARLRRDLGRRSRMATANETILLEDAIFIRELSLGQLQANNLPVYVGDFHVFALWEMIDRPTLLLGMDVISKAHAMAVDYGRATVHFRLH